MNVLIVDDEPLARERLAQMFNEIPEVRVIGSAVNGLQAIERIRDLRPDLVLMDIQMPVMDGMEAAHHLRLLDDPPALVFCTAFDEYALEAFEAAAIDYLVKPIRADRLRAALARARRFQGDGETGPPTPAHRSHLCARIRGNLELVPIDDVIYLMAEHKYVTVVHAGGEVLIEEPLKSLEAEFGDRFLRVHRNALVALDRIMALEKDAAGQVMVRLHDCDRTLEVSRRNLPTVRKVIKSI